MKGERVFVSGGAGVIGNEIVPRLIELGAQIFVGDLKPRPKLFPAEIKYRQGDLNTLTAEELESFSPTIFIHLAATFERTSESYEFWDENFWHNIRLSHHLMGLHKDLHCLKRVVFASSYLIYDSSQYQFKEPSETPVYLDETMSIYPRNLTGMAKLAHEIELNFLEHFKSDQFTFVAARIFRGYGKNSRDVISRWIRAALQDKVLTVFRAEGLFDYIYAADTAEGLIRLAKASELKGIVNLGTGRARRVSDIIGVIKSNIPEANIEVDDSVTDIDYEASCANMKLFSSHINWLPKYDIESAISEMIEFEKSKLFERAQDLVRNVLITSAARKIPLINSVVSAAKLLDSKNLVYAGDVNSMAHSRYVSDGFVHLPATEPNNIDKIIKICRKLNINVIIPTRDGELLFWAENLLRFRQEGIDVIISEAVAVSTSVDKLAFSLFGLDNNLPVIPAWESPQGKGPFVVKERFGAGSRSIGLNLSREQAIKHGKSLNQPIFQPYIVGQEISVDAWVSREHKVKGLVLRVRNEVVNGESVVTTTFRDHYLEKQCSIVLEALPLRGPVVLQLIVDESGHPHIIELNARFGGASTTSIAAGLDIWYWTLLETNGENLENYPFHQCDQDIRQVRVPQDLVIYGSDF